MSGLIVAPFAGPGGWSEGLRMLGLADVGIEWDAAACATRAAAGHLTIRADVATYPPERFAGAEGAIFSPPCPDWSVAGKRAGRAGTSGHLIDIVPAWVEAIRPRWVACEQVPPCLPIWQEHAARYRQLGYSTWCGTLNAADYGVPQVRQRAILLARRDGRLCGPPAPTHAENPSTLFGPLRPWVTMEQAIGWGWDDAPARTICGDRKPRWLYQDRDGTHGRVLPDWARLRPATTLVGDPRVFGPHSGSAGEPQSSNSVEVTLGEFLTLQGFEADYPVQGNKSQRFQQVGNAVPPLLAAHVIAAVTGRALDVPTTDEGEAA